MGGRWRYGERDEEASHEHVTRVTIAERVSRKRQEKAVRRRGEWTKLAEQNEIALEEELQKRREGEHGGRSIRDSRWEAQRQ